MKRTLFSYFSPVQKKARSEEEETGASGSTESIPSERQDVSHDSPPKSKVTSSFSPSQPKLFSPASKGKSQPKSPANDQGGNVPRRQRVSSRRAAAVSARKKNILDSDSEEDEDQPSGDEYKAEGDEPSDDEPLEEDAGSDYEEQKRPKPSAKRSSGGRKSASTPVKSFSTGRSSSSPSGTSSFLGLNSHVQKKMERFNNAQNDRRSWLESPRDSMKRTPDDPEYDARSLFIPSAAFSQLSQFEQQYWDIKKNHYDVVIFFKKGKFYELYEKDADIGVQELDLKLTERVNMRMAGVPESSFEYWAAKLVAKGYKVGRVEQMETMDHMNKRLQGTPTGKGGKGGAKSSAAKVCHRELTLILTAGTLVDENMLPDADPQYLLSLYQKPTSGSRTYGVTIMDAATANFFIGTIEEASATSSSELETLLHTLQPVEIVIEHGNMDSNVREMLKQVRNVRTQKAVVLNEFAPGREFPSFDQTVQLIEDGGYFGVAGNGDQIDSAWPVDLRIAHRTAPHALQSFGATLSYLQKLKLDRQLVTCQQFRWFSLPEAQEGPQEGDYIYEQFEADESAKSQQTPKKARRRRGLFDTQNARTMIIDGQTLANLEVVSNQLDGSPRIGTLYGLLDHCETAFGSRLLKSWCCRPLVSIDDINARLQVVEFLLDNEELRTQIRDRLHRIPDLERLVARIHSLTLADERKAVFYENMEIKKLHLLLKAMDGFQLISSIVRKLEKCELPPLLEHLVESIPDIDALLEPVTSSFDREQALRDEYVIPRAGTIPALDKVDTSIAALEAELAAHLNEIRDALAGKNYKDRMAIKYSNIGKEENQIEIPAALCSALDGRGSKNLFEGCETIQNPGEFSLMTQTKLVKRYYTPFIRNLIPKLRELREDRQEILADVLRQILCKFDANLIDWNISIHSTAELDCLISLAMATLSLPCDSCKPTFVEPENGENYVDFSDLVHPVVCASRITATTGGDFIPNDVRLGRDDIHPVMVLTGPNMGGKSTLLRQVCLAIIMGQMGCYVPARMAKLTVVDRMFTRLGASDRIMAGQSTFMVELSETSNMLANATSQSLVVLDELGRGTSTFDGYAIAYAVVNHLARHLKCRTLFSTHYHLLTEDIQRRPESQISMFHMQCIVGDASDDGHQYDVTFLYKLGLGPCPKSYGPHVAKLAGLPHEIVARAEQVATEFEQHCKTVNQNRRMELLQRYHPQAAAIQCGSGTTSASPGEASTGLDFPVLPVFKIRDMCALYECISSLASSRSDSSEWKDARRKVLDLWHESSQSSKRS